MNANPNGIPLCARCNARADALTHTRFVRRPGDHDFEGGTMADEAPLIIRFDEVVAELKAAGIEAYTEQTGGGCATIMVGELRPVERPSVAWYPASGQEGPDEVVVDGKVRVDRGMVTEDRYRVLVGPGWFEGPRWTDPRGMTEDLYIGPDDDGESDAYICTSRDDVSTVVAEVIRQATKG